MNPLGRIAGLAADRMFGLPLGAVPYVVRRDVAVAMTGGSYLGHTQWAVAPYAEPPLVSASMKVVDGIRRLSPGRPHLPGQADRHRRCNSTG